MAKRWRLTFRSSSLDLQFKSSSQWPTPPGPSILLALAQIQWVVWISTRTADLPLCSPQHLNSFAAIFTAPLMLIFEQFRGIITKVSNLLTKTKQQNSAHVMETTRIYKTRSPTNFRHYFEYKRSIIVNITL